MYNKLIKKLVSIAKVKGYTVQFEAYGIDNCAEIYRQSKVLNDCQKIIVYYNTDFLKLIVLLHEIGHIVTTGLSYALHVSECERIASLWALQFLKRESFSQLNEARILLNKSLKTYEANLL
jgi:hypothetical protein